MPIASVPSSFDGRSGPHVVVVIVLGKGARSAQSARTRWVSSSPKHAPKVVEAAAVMSSVSVRNRAPALEDAHPLLPFRSAFMSPVQHVVARPSNYAANVLPWCLLRRDALQTMTVYFKLPNYQWIEIRRRRARIALRKPPRTDSAAQQRAHFNDQLLCSLDCLPLIMHHHSPICVT